MTCNWSEVWKAEKGKTGSAVVRIISNSQLFGMEKHVVSVRSVFLSIFLFLFFFFIQTPTHHPLFVPHFPSFPGTLGDYCQQDGDCNGGVCRNLTCQCRSFATAVTYTTVDNLNEISSLDEIKLKKWPSCFRNYTIVGKGQQCHVDPMQWECKGGDLINYRLNFIKKFSPPLICRSPFICVRCPADYMPEDDSMGYCSKLIIKLRNASETGHCFSDPICV